MTNWIHGDWERTEEVLAGKRPATQNGITWLRHDEKLQAGKIDLEVLKGTASLEEIARKAGTSIVRVKRHLSHLTDDTHQGMTSHQLKITNDGKVSFDLRNGSNPRAASGQVGPASSEKWTDEEFEAAVQAYLWMLEQEAQKEPYSKTETNQRLRQGLLSARSKTSVERRMENISAVLEELSLPWIKGYAPLRNVGPTGTAKIKELLAKHQAYDPTDYSPTDDPELLEAKVQKVRKTINLAAPPKGQKNPNPTSSTASGFARDPAVKAWVLENAMGICEACGLPAPFIASSGYPYLEVHHVKELCNGGTDRPSNTIAACPNCHRRCHHAGDKDALIGEIYQKVSRLVPE